MDNVLIGRSASGFDFSRWTDAVVDGDGCRSIAAMSTLPPHARSVVYGSFPYVPPPLPPFQYTPYLQSSLSLPPLPPPRRPAALLPHPPVMMARTAAKKHAAPPHRPAAAGVPNKPAALRRTTTGLGEYKRKKQQPRAPRQGEEPPPRAQRRKPLERATPLPPATAVDEALDDLEREVTRGFVQDLMHALAPPPSSLPLPTFSLVRAATTMKAAAASCAV